MEREKRRKEGGMGRRKRRGGRGLLLAVWAVKLVSEQQLDSRDAWHTLPNSSVCF